MTYSNQNKSNFRRDTIAEVSKMHKNKSNQQKRKEHTPEKVELIVNAEPDENQNKNHNTKKVSLGTNTRHL